MVFLTTAEPEGPTASSGNWRFTLAADHPCFEGHFDGEPVLPGIAHIAVALEACAVLRGDLPPLAGVDDLRFSHAVVPDTACEVSVRADSPTSAQFDIRCEGQPSSRGRLRFTAPWHSGL